MSSLLDGGPGNDSLVEPISSRPPFPEGNSVADRFVGGTGNDVIKTFSDAKAVDRVECGSGRDDVRRDPSDTVSGCERFGPIVTARSLGARASNGAIVLQLGSARASLRGTLRLRRPGTAARLIASGRFVSRAGKPLTVRLRGSLRGFNFVVAQLEGRDSRGRTFIDSVGLKVSR